MNSNKENCTYKDCIYNINCNYKDCNYNTNNDYKINKYINNESTNNDSKINTTNDSKINKYINFFEQTLLLSDYRDIIYNENDFEILHKFIENGLKYCNIDDYLKHEEQYSENHKESNDYEKIIKRQVLEHFNHLFNEIKYKYEYEILEIFISDINIKIYNSLLTCDIDTYFYFLSKYKQLSEIQLRIFNIYLNWNNISQYQILSCNSIYDYRFKLNWNLVTKYQVYGLNYFSFDIIYLQLIDIPYLCRNNKYLINHFSEKIQNNIFYFGAKDLYIYYIV